MADGEWEYSSHSSESTLNVRSLLIHLYSYLYSYQCQATVVGFLAAVFAILMDWLPEGEFNFDHAILLCASSLLTASLASFVLGRFISFCFILFTVVTEY